MATRVDGDRYGTDEAAFVGSFAIDLSDRACLHVLVGRLHEPLLPRKDATASRSEKSICRIRSAFPLADLEAKCSSR